MLGKYNVVANMFSRARYDGEIEESMDEEEELDFC